jgi:hypothetical protein
MFFFRCSFFEVVPSMFFFRCSSFDVLPSKFFFKDSSLKLFLKSGSSLRDYITPEGGYRSGKMTSFAPTGKNSWVRLAGVWLAGDRLAWL